MNNIFSIFDPSSPTPITNNWISLLIPPILTNIAQWPLTSNTNNINNIILSILFENTNIHVNTTPYIIIFTLPLFIIISLNNLISITPYNFTPSAHLSVSISLALPMWICIIIFAYNNNINNITTDILPLGTPYILIPFLVIIETISLIIRPITLSIRLTANIIAGHILISILTSIPVNSQINNPTIPSAELAITLLELAVCVIQAYVFILLITLYFNETI